MPRQTKVGNVRSSEQRRPVHRRRPGDLTAGDFLGGIRDAVRAHLSHELQNLNARQQGSLIKFYAEDSAIHFELWLHRSRGRAELGLHFETRDPDRNRRLLDYVAEVLLFLKEALGHGLEAEPWDKGWTRLYISYPLEHLGADEQAHLAAAFAAFIETLEPIRRDAIKTC